MGNTGGSFGDCRLDEEVKLETKTPWSMYQARHREKKVSVFVYDGDSGMEDYVNNASKTLRTIRHPNIIKVHGIESFTDCHWLITDRVIPLETSIANMTPVEIVAGIQNILEAVIFLHERCRLCHNNIGVTSVFVAGDGTWKLGGMEYVCPFEKATSEYLSKCRTFRDPSALPPEEKATNSSVVPELAAEKDAFSFGLLAEQLIELLTGMGDLTKTFELRIQDEFLHQDPQQRPKLSSLQHDGLFRSDFINILNFITHITLKSQQEKKLFFSDLVRRLYTLPVDLVAQRLARPLLARFVLLELEACHKVLPHLLTPFQGSDKDKDYSEGCINPILPENLFRKHVVPELYKIFHVRDVHIRLQLLMHFDAYVHLFDKATLSTVLLPQILLGLRDTNDELVTMSLHAVACLVPILGGDVVIGANRLKLFSAGRPKLGDQRAGVDVTPHLGSTAHHNGDIPHCDATKAPSTVLLKDLAKKAERDQKRELAQKRREERQHQRGEKQHTSGKIHKLAEKRTVQFDDSEDVHSANDADADQTGHGVPVHSCSPQDSNNDSSLVESSAEDASETVLDEEHAQPVHVDWCDIGPKSLPKAPYSPGNNKSGILKLKAAKTPTSPPPKQSCSPSISALALDNDPSWEEDWGTLGGAPPEEMPVRNVQSPLLSPQTYGEPKRDYLGEEYSHRYSPSKSSGDKTVSNLQTKPHGMKLGSSAMKKKDPNSSEQVKSSSFLNETSSAISAERLQATRSWTNKKSAQSDFDTMDIKTIPSAHTSSEMDFFVDMAPKIENSPNLWKVLQAGGDDLQAMSRQSSQVATRSFAVADSISTDADGWGDDLDWGVDDS